LSVSRKEILDALNKVRAKKGERNFKQSIDLVVNLKDIDLKRPENRVNVNVNLPNGLGKNQKICFFATGDLGLRAKRAEVDLVVDQEQLRELSTKRKDAKKLLSKYDLFLAEASLMPIVGRVAGPILGPRGKMPTPVPSNAPIEQFIERQRKAVALRTRDKPLIELSVGTEDMEDEKIAENIDVLLTSLLGGLKRGLSNIRSIYLKTTMGEPVRLK
jgi:large subunit ribosomal protein L1